MKRTKIRKKTKVTSEKLRHKAVTLAKKIVRHNQNYSCEFCGKREPNVRTHGSHIYSEGTYRAMSADLDNILCLCYTHHIGAWNTTEPSWHGNPIEMIEWFQENYPDRYKTLKERTRQSIQADEFFWTKKLEELTEIREAQENER